MEESSTGTLVHTTLEALRNAIDPERREHSTGYLPTRFRILGVSAPAQRRILRPLDRSLRGAPPSELLTVALALVDTAVHEARQIAFELVGGRQDVVRVLDASRVERLGAGNDNWASVDSFGVYVAGPAWRDGRVADQDVLRWASSPDRWWRRTALVATVPLNRKSRGGRGDPQRTLAICDALAGDSDPMVAKALSWALRSLLEAKPAAVRDFLELHADGLPSRVRREVRNKLETGRKSGKRR